MRFTPSGLLRLIFLLALTPVALAATWYVNGVSGSDSNSCASATTACKTIGHAISLAASGDSINVATGTYTENLGITINLRLIGSGAKSTVIDGGGVGRVVSIPNSSSRVVISGVTITDGRAFNGGGVWNNGILTITNSTVSGNFAAFTCRRATFCRLSGGGILSSGAVLTIRNSTISGNNVQLLGCSVGYCTVSGGGISSGGTLTIINSTIANNTLCCRALIRGSGISATAATVRNGTIAGNNGGFGAIAGTASLQNSIVANNGQNCSPGVKSLGYNLSSDSTCNFTSVGDLNDTDPQLGPLQYNSGPTQTMALPTGSPAIDAGDPTGCKDGAGHLLMRDQRGMPRPDKEDTGGCDMGAYERQSD